MLSLKNCFGSFQRPWELEPKFHARFESETRVNENMIDQGKKQQVKEQARRIKERGEWGFNMADHLRGDDRKRRDDNIKALQHFQSKLGIDESKYIEEFEACKSGAEVQKLEEKIRKASTKWYEIRLKESRAFEPIEGESFVACNEQIQGHIRWFNSGKRNLMDMAISHEKFNDDIKHQKDFKARLRAQTPFVKKEYLRRVVEIEREEANRAPFSDLPKKDRGQLLNEVLANLKEVKDSPSAVQDAFSKRQAKKEPGKSTKELADEVKAEYEKKCADYRARILENKDYFGGEEVKTPYGKMSQTAWEFIEYFEQDLETFESMDATRKKLNGLIKERRRLFKRRDEILEHANPEERAKLKAKTQKMRRHELEAFLPELELNVRKNSVHVLEYLGLLHTARLGNINLFSTEEVIKMSIQFKLKDLSAQKAYLIVLEDTIEDRKKTASDYFKLPIHARNDDEFLKANAYERENLLRKAQLQLQRERENPLDLSNVGNKSSTEIADEILSRFNTQQGQAVIEDSIEDLDTDVVENQLTIRKRMFGVSSQMENEDLTFKGAYLSDLAKWMRTSKDLWQDENNVHNEREQWKFETLQTAREMYDYGIIFTSGGQIQDLQKVSMDDFRKGKGDAVDRVQQAKYSQHTLLMGDDGKDVLDPMEATKQEFMEEAMKLVEMLILKLGYGKMKLSSSVIQVIRNSEDIQKALAKKLIAGEFGSLLTPDAANNTDHYIEEMVSAA